MKISDGYHMKVFRFKLGQHPGKIRKLFAVNGEGKILILKVDIQIDGVSRYFVGSEAIGDFQYPRLRIVAVS